MLRLNSLVLSKITSSFSVVVDENRLNLGLNLKFEAKKLKVLGYSRRGDNGWEFSEKAIDLLKEYMLKFPEFFDGIQRNPQGDLYSDTDFFDPSESKAKIREIQDWLKGIQSRSFEKVPLEAQQLDGDYVKEIERAADEYMMAFSPSSPKRVNNVPRKALLKPGDAEHRLQNQWFSLGDRVVYAQDSGKVPIATRGTVIGLTRTTRHTLLDIVFDVTFMSGTSLNDRCSPFRGMTVPVSSVLNLTNRQLVASSKAGIERSGSHGITTSGLAPATPPPQLMGSFSSAVTGDDSGHQRGNSQPRGGRGKPRGGGLGRGALENQFHAVALPTVPPAGPRGGGGGGVNGFAPRGGNTPRGGATVILQRRPGGGAEVPPPPNLNNPRSARGRGPRGMGRGRGHARGRGLPHPVTADDR